MGASAVLKHHNSKEGAQNKPPAHDYARESLTWSYTHSPISPSRVNLTKRGLVYCSFVTNAHFCWHEFLIISSAIRALISSPSFHRNAIVFKTLPPNQPLQA